MSISCALWVRSVWAIPITLERKCKLFVNWVWLEFVFLLSSTVYIALAGLLLLSVYTSEKKLKHEYKLHNCIFSLPHSSDRFAHPCVGAAPQSLDWPSNLFCSVLIGAVCSIQATVRTPARTHILTPTGVGGFIGSKCNFFYGFIDSVLACVNRIHPLPGVVCQ